MSRSGCALGGEVARGPVLRISTSQTHPSTAGQSEGGGEIAHSSGSRRAPGLVVPSDGGHDGVPSVEDPRPPRRHAPGGGSGYGVLQASDQEDAPSGMASERHRLLRLGLSAGVVNTIMDDKAPGTIVEYES